MEDRNIMHSRMPPVQIPAEGDLFSVLLQGIQRNKASTALVDVNTGRSKTYHDVVVEVDLVARHLVRRGFTRGSVLVVYSVNCVEYVVMSLAALRLGGTFAPVNHLLTAKDLNRLLNLCDGDFIFTSKEVVSNVITAVKGTRVKAIFCKEDHPGCISYTTLVTSSAELPVLPPVGSLGINREKDVACILFSSGTTGLPKAVMLTHHGYIILVALWSAPATRVVRDRVLIFVPMSHVLGLCLFLTSLFTGACSYVMKRFDLQVFLETVSEKRLSSINVVPPIAVILAKHPLVARYDMTCVENVFCGAAPLSAETEKEVCHKLRGSKVKIVQYYGLTETTGFVTSCYSDDDVRPPGVPSAPYASIGALYPTYQGKVVDVDSGAVLEPGERGEFWFRGPMIMKGYLKNQAATDSTIDKEGWLHTGDIGYYDKDGYLFIVDRLKELIKYKGYQVPPAELEALILTHPAVADCGVIGLPDLEAGELPHAWVVPKAGKQLTETEIVDFVKKNTAPYKWLRGGARIVSSVPKTPSGKILRRYMRDAAKMSKI